MHIKTTQITGKQYLQDQLDKHRMTDPVEDILKQFDYQTQQNKTYTHNEQLKNVPNGNSTSNTQQESMKHNTRNNHNKRKITVKIGQKDSVNNMPLLHSNIKEPNEKYGAHTQTRSG